MVILLRAKDVLGFLIFLHARTQGWDYRLAPQRSVYTALGEASTLPHSQPLLLEPFLLPFDCDCP